MIPEIADYKAGEIPAWPAITRYLDLIKRIPETDIHLERHRAWLRAAIATAVDSATARDICEFWSDEADKLILRAWRESGCLEHGYALLALGKLGSRELNLSSDVDLIIVRSDNGEPDAKAVRAFQSLLSETTEFSFALRVDLTLRPGGKSAALIPTFSEFEYHYGYHGEPWERLAYVRLRVLSGDDALVRQIKDFTRKFSYRRHLDFTLLDELKSLRAKIRAEKPSRFHLKLAPGGIRELELFVHALQIVHGGRHPALRTNSTSEALGQIRAMNLLPENECDDLLEIYWYLRTLENRLHAFEDQQNYFMDPTPELLEKTARVCEITDSLFGPETAASAAPELGGFSALSVNETWPELLAATAQSRRTEKDEAARMLFLNGFVETLKREGVDKDLGLSLLLDFVKATRAKASFFTLLNRETQFRDDLARLFSISPYLGSILASRPELVDEFIFRKQADPSADLEILLEELAERRLIVELIASNQFLRDHDLDQLSENLTRNADTICLDLLARLKIEYDAPDVNLIAMGKWGGRELGLRSDLDFVFVTPNEPRPEDHKLARRFLARMTEAHRGGSIYAVDMRLRPSGNAGPMLISQPSLENYLSNEAAAWERQAYLRARPLSNVNVNVNFNANVKRPGLSPADRAELSMIHSKLFKPIQEGALDLKLTDGGLADVEFTAQIALLDHKEFSLDPSTSGMIETLEKIDAAWTLTGPELRRRYRFLRGIEQLYQLTTSQSGSKLRTRSDEFRRLSQVMKCDAFELETRIVTEMNEIADLLKSVRKD